MGNKTLIIYSTKSGSTADLAKQIGEHFDDVVVCYIDKINSVRLDDFSRIIIGSYIHVGKINKKLKKYVSENANILLQKELGLFLCGLQPQESDKVFKDGFGPELLDHAKAKAFLGGVYDPAKTGGFSRFIMKTVAKLSSYTNTIDDAAVQNFVNTMKN